MMRLEALRVVQWYHFDDVTLPIAGSCLLLGDNGSGKTTLLDAIQIALVADASEIMFNKAANEKSRRALYGYVRWKIGSETEDDPGGVRYGRGACTSYVILEFREELDPTTTFACGIGFEATETDKNIAKAYFVIPGKRASEVEPVVHLDAERREVRPLRDFRAWVRGTGAGQEWSDAGTYREEVRHRLGVLPESFHRLIVKALAFKPIGQVRQFVFDYLLDARPIDTASLQANLDHYKRLEGEAKDAEARIHELQEVVREGERTRSEQRTAESHQFMELRADQEIARARVVDVDRELSESQATLVGARARVEEIGRELSAVSQERERILVVLEGHDAYRQLRDLERQEATCRERFEEARTADREARTLLEVQTGALDVLLAERARELRRARGSLFDREDLLGAEEMPEVVERLRRTLTAEGALGGRDLATWLGRLDRADDCAREVKHALAREFAEAKREGAALQEEQRALEAGRQVYPEGPAALLHLLTTRLKGKRQPRPLCELIEVSNQRWRNAVEGYLNTRRFDVIVDAEDYSRALGLFERHKRDYPLPGRGAVFIGGAGLVDIERVMRNVARPEPRSLAEQVTTDDPLARAYCDHVLGDIVCVDDEQSLRKHRSAITDTVMVYRGHVARQTQLAVFSRHFIGEAARLRRLDDIAKRLTELHGVMSTAGAATEFLTGVVRMLDRARAEGRRLPDLVSRAEGLDRLRSELDRLAVQRGLIDRSSLTALQGTLEDLLRKRGERETERDRVNTVIGDRQRAVQELTKAAREAAEASARAAEGLAVFLASREPDVQDTLEKKYARERSERSPAEIHEVFERQRRGIESRIGNWIAHLVALKASYVERRGLVAKVEGADYDEFERELEAWQESRLPEYRQRIADAKKMALEQLAEDVVFRLRENLLLVRKQIQDLNRALKDVSFGSERYEFLADVEPDHADFYHLVVNATRFEKEPLFAATTQDEPTLRSQLGDLLDRLLEAEAKEVRTELEAKADYREYFRYDLKIHHADGAFSLYDKVADDKSGGETQTPYYIAILASIYRMYCSRSAKRTPTCGVVLLDEAFGKMDEPRIRATLTFARRLALQLILATPKERSELVAPHVERSLLVYKEPVGGLPTVMDFTKELAGDAEEAVGIATG